MKKIFKNFNKKTQTRFVFNQTSFTDTTSTLDPTSTNTLSTTHIYKNQVELNK